MTLKEISWQVDEPTYRADSALSYSTLARFYREGFNNLDKLFDKVESPSLTFGSIVDTLVTGGKDFDKLFVVADIDNNLSEALVKIAKRLYDVYKDSYITIESIPDAELLTTIEDIPWNNHWLGKTRVKKIKEDCSKYYSLLYVADGRTIISMKDYLDANNCLDALQSSQSTKFYFMPNDAFDDNIVRDYQLKFKATFDDIDYRCMADELITIKDKQLVIPVDLKTSSKPEWDFYKSFVQWNYQLQARLYWRIIRANMDKDPVLKDYTLADYRFIVVNKNTLKPLVWEFENTQKKRDMDVGLYTFKDPFILGKELTAYLQEKPEVPFGIHTNGTNSINTWLEYENC